MEKKEIIEVVEDRKKIAEIKSSIDVNDNTSLISYGASAQRKSSDFVDAVLDSSRTRDLGETGEMLTSLVKNIQGFDISVDGSGNFITRFFTSAASKLSRMQTSYKSAEANIDKIVDGLEKHRRSLIEDISMLEKLYDKNIEYINDLKLYIDAGELKLQDLYDKDLPALKAEAEEANDQLVTQKYQDAMNSVSRFEKKVHDLKLTRTVSLQMLPQIRLQQANNNVLVDKIHSSIVNTIPLWKSQMVIALGLNNSASALRAQKAVTDATNEMLRKNSEMLKTATIETAKESERAIVDIEVIKKANDDIVSAIQQVVAIQKEGREKRKTTEQEIARLETELKDNIINALDKK